VRGADGSFYHLEFDDELKLVEKWVVEERLLGKIFVVKASRSCEGHSHNEE
jgi:hypothetical protein